MIGLLDILKGYEVAGKDALDRGDRKNAVISFRKILSEIGREGVLPSEANPVVFLLRKVYGYFLDMEQFEDALECIFVMDAIADKKIQIVKEGRLFFERIPKDYDISSLDDKIKKAFGSSPELMETYRASFQPPRIQQNVVESGQETETKERPEPKTVQPAQETPTDKEVNIAELKYELAKKENERGNRDIAMRMLEELVAEFPQEERARSALNEIKKAVEAEEKEKAFEQLMKDMEVTQKEERDVLSELAHGNIDKANELVTRLLAKEKSNSRLYVIKAYVAKKKGNLSLFNNFKSYAEKIQPTIIASPLYRHLIDKEEL
ncbi:MAG: hypothetical protein M1515_02675 [Candidatus Thermoplasmatota archaeon]|nr:hypothetical protein [Candidatus Thermoplasmatota archaeon]